MPGQRPGAGDPRGALPAVCVEVQSDRTSLVSAPDTGLPGHDPAQRRLGRRADEEGQDADRSVGGGGSPRQGLRNWQTSEPSHQGHREPGPRHRPAPMELSHLTQCVISVSYFVSVPSVADGVPTQSVGTSKSLCLCLCPLPPPSASASASAFAFAFAFASASALCLCLCLC